MMAVDNHDRLAAAAEAGEIAAWIAYDAERPDVSHALAAEAATLARRAGDRDMGHFIASHITMLDIEQGRPAQAVRVSNAILQTRLAPRARAVFLIRRGRALVRLGDAQGGLTDLHQARMLTGEGPSSSDPWWAWWADDSEVAWQEGTARADLGDWRAAVPLLHEAASARAKGHGARTVHHDRATLLEALVRAGAWADIPPALAVLSANGPLISSARTSAVLRRAAAHAGSGPEDLTETVRGLAA